MTQEINSKAIMAADLRAKFTRILGTQVEETLVRA